MVEDQSGAYRRLRRRRLYEREGRARIDRRFALGLLEWRYARIRRSRRLGADRRDDPLLPGALLKACDEANAVCEEAAFASADDLARSASRRRSQLRGSNARRHVAGTGVRESPR